MVSLVVGRLVTFIRLVVTLVGRLNRRGHCLWMRVRRLLLRSRMMIRRRLRLILPLWVTRWLNRLGLGWVTRLLLGVVVWRVSLLLVWFRRQVWNVLPFRILRWVGRCRCMKWGLR